MGELEARFGTARHPERDSARPRTAGLDDPTVSALGELSAALEVVEEARGQLYGFHRKSGEADLALQGAVRSLRAAGHRELADEIDRVLVGRDTIAGRWTFQLVEDYDAGYWSVFREVERVAREQLAAGVPHVFEAEMKREEQRSGTAPAD
ncbi:hypothetical protein [Nakamurella alba]|uniref:hypothetical protein n=1 Tax=Nakamurella alba TaxID=2665158 RepID=UPI0012B7A7E6|nr:hypothetical protein [Nakamurella alba]